MARPSQHKSGKLRVAIVGDGQTEKIYFSDIKDTDRPDDIDLFPSLPARIGDYTGVLNKAIDLAPDYARVFALIDLDKVISDGVEEAYRVAKQAAEDNGVIVLENNPCFEFWMLLHFVNSSRSFTNCDQVEDELTRPGRITGYKKNQKYLIAARLYFNYQERLRQQAMPAARRLETNRPDGNRHFPRAQIFLFFEWYFSKDKSAP